MVGSFGSSRARSIKKRQVDQERVIARIESIRSLIAITCLLLLASCASAPPAFSMANPLLHTVGAVVRSTVKRCCRIAVKTAKTSACLIAKGAYTAKSVVKPVRHSEWTGSSMSSSLSLRSLLNLNNCDQPSEIRHLQASCKHVLGLVHLQNDKPLHRVCPSMEES